MHWMILPYRRYFEFSGRSRRREFWMFVLFYALVGIAISIIWGTGEFQQTGFFVGFSSNVSGVGGVIQNLFWLASLIPSIAVGARRLHDVDRSGWWQLLLLVPLFGWVVLLVFWCLDGNHGPNRFGGDPKGRADADVFA
jgi:uncharacterized membrane protein YhaH (DUF805 family)